MDIKRKCAFSAYERELLKELISQYASIIECKKTDAVYNKKKNLIWQEITNKFNASPQCQKVTAEQIKKLWSNMKTRARDAKSLEKQRMHTGGGPYLNDMDAEDESVLAIVPNILPTVKVLKDSDGAADSQADDDSIFWLPKSVRVTMQPDIFYPSTTSTITSEIETNMITSIANTTPTTTPTTSAAPPRSRIANKIPVTIDSLKLELVREDIQQRKRKFEMEMAHLEKMNLVQYEMAQQELEHKKKLFKLIEAEQQAKLNRINQ